MSFSEKFIGSESPADGIMKAKEGYESDDRPEKIATFIGQITDPETGKAYMPSTVRDALIDVIEQDSKYLGSAGDPQYLDAYARHFIFGEELWDEKVKSTVSVQTLGGTGALHLATQLLKDGEKNNMNMLYDPGWPNHKKIFRDFTQTTYLRDEGYDHDSYMKYLMGVDNSSTVLLQTAGYNGDGIERSREQWKEILTVIRVKNLVPIFDTAYNGLAEGWDEDVEAIRLSTKQGITSIVCASQSKNTGLYGHRVGALYVTNVEADAVHGMQSFLANDVARSEYSNPTKIGAALGRIYNCTELRDQLRKEVDDVCKGLITNNREDFVEGLGEKYAHLKERRGIFLSVGSMSNEQHQHLLEKSVHGLQSGRVCVGSLHPDTARKAGEIYSEVLDS